MSSMVYWLPSPAKAPHSASGVRPHRRPQITLSAVLSHPDKPGTALATIKPSPSAPILTKRSIAAYPNRAYAHALQC